MRLKWMAALLLLGLLLNGIPAQAECWTLEAETPLWGSGWDKRCNVELAAEQLDGTEIGYGESFSFNETVGPRTKEAGYRSAVNGRGVRVVGGGVSQLATTLYLAIRDSGYVELAPFMTYDEKFTEWYVGDGSDAVVTDYRSGRDFSFTSWYEGVIRISAWVDEEYVYCSLEFDDGSWRDASGAAAVASTPLYGSMNKRENIRLASDAIFGTTLEWGDGFSFNEIVGPRKRTAGFSPAINGRGVRVIGGGVAQVASTVYLAAKELNSVIIDPVRTYGDRFTDGYVDDPDDAIVTDYNAGTDFSFTYWGGGTLTILVFEEDDWLICEIYEDW